MSTKCSLSLLDIFDREERMKPQNVVLMSASVSDCLNSQRKPLPKYPTDLSQIVTHLSERMSHRVKACLASAGTRGLPCRQIFANIYPHGIPTESETTSETPKGQTLASLLFWAYLDSISLNHYLLTPQLGAPK